MATQRKANATHGIGKRRRTSAFAVMLLWLLAWSAWAVQPCCETLASLIPHHPQAGAAHAQAEPHGAHDSGPPTRDHTHCPTAKPVDLNTPVPVAGLGSSYSDSTFLYPLASQVCPLWVVQQHRISRPRHPPPQPLSPPPFLAQRLLI